MAIITPVVREESVEAIYLSAGKTLLLPQFAPNREQEICLIKRLKIYLDEMSSVCVSERERARSPRKKRAGDQKHCHFHKMLLVEARNINKQLCSIGYICVFIQRQY